MGKAANVRITPARMVGVLGAAAKPKVVWQKQFDYFDEELVRLSQTDWDKVPDLWYYFHDLAYVDLQPDLFRHLFPACLKYWYGTLMRGDSADRGGEDFHRALIEGQISDKMLTPNEREALVEFFRDGFLDRVEAQGDLSYDPGGKVANAWICRFNSLGIVAPVTGQIWDAWWMLNHPGKARCAVMYASGLVYLKGENPIYAAWTPEQGGGGPYLTEIDGSIFGRGWREDNLEFLKKTLSVDYITAKLDQAARELAGFPEAALVSQVANDARGRADVIELRIDDLLDNLARVELDKDFWD
jgi:hypothetical protein